MLYQTLRALCFVLGINALYAYMLDFGLFHLTQQPFEVSITREQDSNTVTLNQGTLGFDLLSRLGANETIRIERTPGGDHQTLRQLQRRNVIIDGQCVSACVWLLVTSENVCFTPRATFSFHAWHTVYSPQYFRSYQLNGLLSWEHRDNLLTQTYIDIVREPIRTEIAGLTQTSGVITVPTPLFLEAYADKVCT